MTSKPHLLFLEDEDTQMHMIEGYYKRCPLSSITTAEFFQSPSAAIERVKQGSVDYFILDMMLGNVDGYDVISNICRQPCKPKIWVYSAYEKKPDTRNRHIEEYIEKSRGLGRLFSKLEESILRFSPVICGLKSRA